MHIVRRGGPLPKRLRKKRSGAVATSKATITRDQYYRTRYHDPEPPPIPSEPPSVDGPAGYRQYMASKEWRGRRARYFAHHHSRVCRACGFSNPKINLHHRTYEHLGNEPDRDLVPLCPVCHDIAHQLHDLYRDQMSLSEATDAAIERIRTLGRLQVVDTIRAQRRNRTKNRRPLYGLSQMQAFQRERGGDDRPMPTGERIIVAGTSRARLPRQYGTPSTAEGVGENQAQDRR